MIFKLKTKLSDNISISGMKAEDFYEVAKKSDLSRGEYSFIQPGIVYVSSSDNSAKTASSGQFYIVLESGKKNALESVVMKYRGTTINNFKFVENSGYVTVKATITPGKYPVTTSMSFCAVSRMPIKPENLLRGTNKESQQVLTDTTKEISLINVESKDWNMGKYSLFKINIDPRT